MAASPAEHRAYVWQLVRERERIYALLRLLDVNIDVRRELEDLRKMERDGMRSVDVEKIREELQGEMARLREELDAALIVLQRSNHG